MEQIENENNSQGKRKADPKGYQRNIIKKSRVKGEPYRNYKGCDIPGKGLGFRCSCKGKCFDKFSNEELQENLKRFYSMDTKDQQDVFLQGQIEPFNVQRRRARVQVGNKSKSNSFKYYALKGSAKIQVCLNAFTSVYNTTLSRVRRLKDLAILGKSPRDLRGQNQSGNKFGNHVQLSIRQHIESFPVKLSHYANREVKYLDSQLNLKIMYDLFQQKYPAIKVSYPYYTRYFRENFSLRFGRPQVDVCSTCETLNNKIKNPHLNEVAKQTAVAELMVHKRRTKKFYTKLRNESNEPRTADNILALSIDFMQNIQLPKTPVGEVFYYQQLTVSVFCIHNIKDNTARMYLYHEGQAKKTANEIGSFLLDYIKENSDNITEIHLYSDNCWGQNKNHTLIRMLLSLTDSGRFLKIIHYFPVRGHSFLPCDRDFAVVKRKLRRCDRFSTVHEITELIVTSSNSKKFTVKEVKTEEIINLKDWWPKLYKKNSISEETSSKNTPRNQKVHFNISTFSQFTYDIQKKGCVKASQFIDGALEHTFKLQQSGKSAVVLPSNLAYPLGKVPMKAKKLQDIRKCAAFVEEEYQEFYNSILLWPTITNN